MNVDIYVTTADGVQTVPTDVLSAAELRRLSRYHRRQDAIRFALGVSKLRREAGARLGVAPEDVSIDRTCSDCSRPHGPPVIARTTLGCSVSYAGSRVVVALCEGGRVGVDVEAEDQRVDWALLAPRLNSPDELRPVSQRGFLRTWTRKEALLKLSRDGLRVPMTAITLLRIVPEARLDQFSLLGAPQSLIGAVVEDLRFHGDLVGAVATFGSPTEVIVSSGTETL